MSWGGSIFPKCLVWSSCERKWSGRLSQRSKEGGRSQRQGLLLWARKEGAGGVWALASPLGKNNQVFLLFLTMKRVSTFSFLGLLLAMMLMVLVWWEIDLHLYVSFVGFPHTGQVVAKLELKTSISQMTHVPGGMMCSLPTTEKGEITSHETVTFSFSPHSPRGKKAHKYFLSDFAFGMFLKTDLLNSQVNAPICI